MEYEIQNTYMITLDRGESELLLNHLLSWYERGNCCPLEINSHNKIIRFIFKDGTPHNTEEDNGNKEK